MKIDELDDYDKMFIDDDKGHRWDFEDSGSIYCKELDIRFEHCYTWKEVLQTLITAEYIGCV